MSAEEETAVAPEAPAAESRRSGRRGSGGKEDAPEEPQEFEFEGVHADWKSEVVIKSTGEFTRKGGWFSAGKDGDWEVSGKDMIMKWDEYEPETLTTEDDGKSFKNKDEEGKSFTLTMSEGEPPEWFLAKFKPEEEEQGPCMTACLMCCPAHVTDFEGEPKTVAQKVWSAVEDAVEKLDDGIDAVQDKAEAALDAVANAADAVRDAAIDALGLDDKFKRISDNALDDAAPKAGETVVEDAVQFIPGFKKLDNMTSKDLDQEAKDVCSNKILSFRERIHDFCEDVVEFFKEGADLIGSALKCLYKVVSWILKACKAGVQMAVDLLKKVIPDCCEAACLSCCALTEKIAKWVKQVYDKIVDFVEDLIKKALHAIGVPDYICEKVDFNGNNGAGRNVDCDNAKDDDEPMKKIKQRQVEGEAAPEQQAMEGEAAAPQPVV